MAEGMKITAPDLLRFGVIDRVIAEPPGGAHADPERAIASVGQAIEEELKSLAGLSPDALRAQRNERFCAIGRTLT
jgi:acetyl-CoA carboxylase carboxyl transferase subunit alpha